MLKKALIVSSILFSSATVFGMCQLVNDSSEHRQSECIQLITAIKDNNRREVKEIFNRHINKLAVLNLVLSHKNNQKMNKKMPHDRFALYHKSIFQSPSIVKLVNSSDEQGVTPVFMAVCKNNLKIVDYLVAHGANINEAVKYSFFVTSKMGAIYQIGQKNSAHSFAHSSVLMGSMYTTQQGTTPLHIATFFGYGTLAEYLVEHGADINAQDDTGKSPLHLAFCNNDIKLLKYLVEKGADVKVKDANGDSLLCYAFCYSFMRKNKGIAEYLIEHGADVNEKARGRFPLFYATLYNDESLVRCLIDHGADINKADDYGVTPLLMAVDRGDINLIGLLVEKGADVNVKNDRGNTPLSIMINANNVPLTRLLLEHGADANKESWKGYPLAMAVNQRNEKIVKLLMKYGADVNKADDYGVTPLWVAVKNGDLDMISTLKKFGADINQELNRKTPLHHAIQKGNIAMMLRLINLGADINKMDSEGVSPLSFLKSNISSFPENKRDKLVKFLVKKGAVEYPNLPKTQAAEK